MSADEPKIRIVLAHRRRMLRELLQRVLSRQPDLEIVGQSTDPIDLLLAVSRSEADVVILDEANSRGLRSHLLAEFPHLTLLDLSSDGEVAVVEQLYPHRWKFSLAESDLPRVLRWAVRTSRSGLEPTDVHLDE